MVTGILPEDGPAQIGSIVLPAGRRQYTDHDHQLVAWATTEPMQDAGRAWLSLSDACATTGLTPVLLHSSPASPEDGGLPYFGFYYAVDRALLDFVSAEDVLAASWISQLEPRSTAERAPFGDQFPGLAPAESQSLPEATLLQALSTLPPAYLGLVSTSRPADVPASVGWSVFGIDFDYPEGEEGNFPDEIYPPGVRSIQIGAVLRSWESRFGARLLRIGGDATLQVLAKRPPHTPELARRLAAEHFAFADEVTGTDDTVTSIAARVISSPIWEFWWD